MRRLEYENDTFAFGDKLISKWYPGAAKVGARAGGAAAGEGQGTRPAAAGGDCGAAPARLLACAGPLTPASLRCALLPQDKSGLLLVVTAGKDGALTGGAKFMSAVGDDLIDSVGGGGGRAGRCAGCGGLGSKGVEPVPPSLPEAAVQKQGCELRLQSQQGIGASTG